MRAILIVVGEMIPKRLEHLNIGESIKTIQTTALLKSARILKTWKPLFLKKVAKLYVLTSNFDLISTIWYKSCVLFS